VHIEKIAASINILSFIISFSRGCYKNTKVDLTYLSNHSCGTVLGFH